MKVFVCYAYILIRRCVLQCLFLSNIYYMYIIAAFDTLWFMMIVNTLATIRCRVVPGVIKISQVTFCIDLQQS